jgi:hypothetical protein
VIDEYSRSVAGYSLSFVTTNLSRNETNKLEYSRCALAGVRDSERSVFDYGADFVYKHLEQVWSTHLASAGTPSFSKFADFFEGR